MAEIFYSAAHNTFFPERFYDEYVASGLWPKDAVKVTKEEWKVYGESEPPDGYLRGTDENGKPAWVPIPPASINDLATQALSRINSGYQAQMGQILNDYPQAETLTFDKQEREARQWQADNSVATPYIDAMLVERPLDKAELVGRILAKADAFTQASGMATGKRQRLEEEVKAALEAEDRDALEAIDW
ncbi:hypothetical protein [Halomonas sp. BN3-1]|uniref:hypothetical protein n=1 Tax=Halomonas sp. BN3-1 TaxID=2082393 RepID=UPI000D3B90B6|nr:hypothetical protein [Halomonas sp. BN3-1]